MGLDRVDQFPGQDMIGAIFREKNQFREEARLRRLGQDAQTFGEE